MNWLIWTPIIVLGTLLLLFGLMVLLGRVAGGRYLLPIVRGLSKLPFLRRLFERMSNAALERENPELASAIRKLQRFGTPTTPEAAQRAMARLTPGERRAYLQAAGQQAPVPEAPNRAARRNPPACNRPQARAPGPGGRRRSANASLSSIRPVGRIRARREFRRRRWGVPGLDRLHGLSQPVPSTRLARIPEDGPESAAPL